MSTKRKQLIALIEQGAIPHERIDQAITVAGIHPHGRAWRSFGDKLLLVLGALALAFSVLFLVAYNWAVIGRFARFGLVELAILLAVFAWLKLGTDRLAGKVSLLVAVILVGVLLALFGQTYQTGADPWQLFFSWSLLILPWAMAGRFAAIWVVWVLLLNLSIVLYHQAFQGVLPILFSSQAGMLWLLFLLNTIALASWEILAPARSWLDERWAVRLLAVGSGVAITWLVMHAIFAAGETTPLYGLAWLAWLGGLYLVYRKRRPDLFMLAGGCLSAIVVVVSLVVEYVLLDETAGGFLLLALLVIGLGGASAVWLRQVHCEQQT